MKYTVLSLFDGMSGGHLALDRAGVKVKDYYASEVDKYAMQVTMANYPDTIQLGSVIDLKKKQLKKLFKGKKVILMGGSPCQGFSVSGKMKGSSTACGIDVTSLKQYMQLKKEGFEFNGQSYLFWEYVRVWKIIKPKYFFLENVRVTKKWLPMFNEAMGVEPVMVNSALVSAQNRVRYYWSNIPKMTQPKDRGILLRDIIEDGEATEEMTSKGKSYCMTARYNGAVAWNSIERKQRTMVLETAIVTNQGKTVHRENPDKSCCLLARDYKGFGNQVMTGVKERPCTIREPKQDSECIHIADADDINGHDILKRVYHPDGKSPTLNTCSGGNREAKVLCGASRGRKKKGDKEYTQKIETRKDDKSNALTTVPSDNLAVETAKYRKLTPLECERLQTVPEGYTAYVSNSQRYKMLGNGWTIEVIAHLFKGLK